MHPSDSTPSHPFSLDELKLIQRFVYRPTPPLDQKNTTARHIRLRILCTRVALELNEILPDGREKSIVMTKLEELGLWGHNAIAQMNPPETAPGNNPFEVYLQSYGDEDND